MADRELMQMALDCIVSNQVPAAAELKQALRAALAQPEPEPVVWMYQDKSTHEVRFQKHMRPYVDHGATYEVPLYTAPPQREWQGLTDEEIWELMCRNVLETDLCKAAEAKLKEKNCG